MAKTVSPEDWERLVESSDVLETAESEALRAREVFIETRTEEARAAWSQALLVQQRAWEQYWAVHREYVETLGPR